MVARLCRLMVVGTREEVLAWGGVMCKQGSFVSVGVKKKKKHALEKNMSSKPINFSDSRYAGQTQHSMNFLPQNMNDGQHAIHRMPFLLTLRQRLHQLSELIHTIFEAL